jgi:uncharacterized membrane protein YgcG
VDVWHTVSGPVESRPGGSHIMLVAGQRVRIDPSTRGADKAVPGKWIEVSGLRDVDGTVVASRIDRRAPGLAIISGRIGRVHGEWRIGGIRVLPPGQAGPAIAGEQVVVNGTYSPGLLVARSMIVNRGLPFPPGPQRFIVQAYARPEGRQLRLGPSIVVTDPPDPRLLSRSTPTVVELRQNTAGELQAVAWLASDGGAQGNGGSDGGGAGGGGGGGGRGSGGGGGGHGR